MARSGSLQVSCVQLRWADSLQRNVAKALSYMNEAADLGSRVVLFPEANLTGYYFPALVALDSADVRAALAAVQREAARLGIWTVVGTIQHAPGVDDARMLNIAHVIDPQGRISYQYAKVHMAGDDERRYCRGGNKMALFEIDGVLCTLVICRDGRHPELYRIPAMAGAQVLFHPSCSSDEIEAVTWKRTSGRAQQPVGPETRICHCVANTVGQSPDGKQTSSGGSFIREPAGLPLAEAGYYQEEMITAVLDLSRADRSYVLDSLRDPPFMMPHWENAIADMLSRKDEPPV